MTFKKRTKHVLLSTLLVVKLELWPAWVALHNWIRIVGLFLFSHNSFYFLNEMNISNQVRTNCTICYVPISHQIFNVYKNTHNYTDAQIKLIYEFFKNSTFHSKEIFITWLVLLQCCMDTLIDLWFSSQSVFGSYLQK